MAAIVQVRNLIFEYRRDNGVDQEPTLYRALDDISFDIEEGSLVAVVGPNGSGKSTLAKTLNGLLVPTEGDVLIDGMNTRSDDLIWKIRSRIGMVFQNPDNQIVSSVVEDDVAFGPENLGVDPKEIRKRVDQALKDVGMYEERKKGPHMLSGGQKQRIAIAGVVAMHPKCIVFDESTAMLDPKGRKQVMQTIHRLHNEGITVIMITHYMEETVDADRIIVLKNGRIFSDSTPRVLFADPKLVKRAGLDMPPAADMRARIAAHGYDLPEGILTEEELVDSICRLK